MIILVVCQRRLCFTLALSIDSCYKTTVSCSIPCLSQGISLIKIHHRIGYVRWSTWTSLRGWGRRETLGGCVRWRRGDLNLYVLGPGVRRQSRRCGGAAVAHSTTDLEQAGSQMQLDSDLLGYKNHKRPWKTLSFLPMKLQQIWWKWVNWRTFFTSPKIMGKRSKLHFWNEKCNYFINRMCFELFKTR